MWKRGVYPRTDPATNELERRLVSFIAADKAGKQVLLGSGFMLFAQGAVALCVTAGHVLSFASDTQRTMTEAERRLAELFGGPGPQLDIQPRSFRILGLDDDGNPHAYIAVHAIQSNNADVAVVWITRQESDWSSSYFQTSHFPVEPALPAVGDELVSIGHFRQEWMEHDIGEGWNYQLTRELVLRSGYVTDVDPSGRYLGIGPNFVTTMPFPAGASGSPVFRAGKQGDPLVICGLVASDMSVPAAEHDCEIDGAGRIASVRSVLSLPLSSGTPVAVAAAYEGRPIKVIF